MQQRIRPAFVCRAMPTTHSPLVPTIAERADPPRRPPTNAPRSALPASILARAPSSMYQLASSGSNLRSGRQSFADGTSPALPERGRNLECTSVCLTTPPSADVPSALPERGRNLVSTFPCSTTPPPAHVPLAQADGGRRDGELSPDRALCRRRSSQRGWRYRDSGRHAGSTEHAISP